MTESKVIGAWVRARIVALRVAVDRTIVVEEALITMIAVDVANSYERDT